MEASQVLPDEDVKKACVCHVIERINQIQDQLKRRSKWCRVLFAACCLSVVFVFPFSAAFMAAVQLHPAAICGTTVVLVIAALSLAWWLFIVMHTCDTDDAICEKAKGSLTLLETRYRLLEPKGGEPFEAACEIILQEILSGVVRPLGFRVRIPPMPQTPITDRIIALASAVSQSTKPGDGGSTSGGQLERRPK